MSPPLLLEARAVAAGFDGIEVLSDVSISIAAGEILLVCGRNGAGKSTLLHTLAGARATIRGSVLLDGRDLRSLSAREIARRIAIVAQS
ncbi:MAG TPA: ATP-binding cassette domain-containing protein, partial [Planctomycetota bacterium]|nr:ATP-binding cassette domain-containing protein [Planctomycetota bacterium]